MGQEITTDEFSPTHFANFRRHLDAEMELLRGWFAGDKFCDDRLQCGMELEGWLVGADGNPAADNTRFLQMLERKWVVPELSKFNFEVNVSPQYLGGGGLLDMRAELAATWSRCEKVAERLGHRVVSIGTLPTVTDEMLCIGNMSPLQRFAALTKQVLRLRGGSPLMLDITGQDHLGSTHRDLMLESAATSVQVHLKVPPRDSVRLYNASVIASALTVACAANAPLVFGKRLWADTRISVFEQAVDTAGPLPRVSFGDRYLKSSLLEVFEQNCSQHRILLPPEIAEPPSVMPYVRMHNGTIWNWNRPLIGFEPDGRPHLRIEHRPMSASPSIADLFADKALYLGLVSYLSRLPEPPECSLSFEDAKRNFYAAARFGFDAKITWLDGQTHRIADLLHQQLLPRSIDALGNWGVTGEVLQDAELVLRGRLETEQNGAAWQLRRFEKNRHDAFELLAEYQRLQETGAPVHTW